MEADQVLDLSLQNTTEIRHEVEDEFHRKNMESEIREKKKQNSDSILHKIVTKPRVPILKLTRVNESVYKPITSLKLVKVALLSEHPEKSRSQEDEANITEMEISEEEQDGDGNNPKEPASAAVPEYTIQKEKKKKKKVRFTTYQVSQMLNKSNSSSNTSVELIPEELSPTAQTDRTEKQVSDTRESKKPGPTTVSNSIVTSRDEQQQTSSATAEVIIQNNENQQPGIIIQLPPIKLPGPTIVSATTTRQFNQSPTTSVQTPNLPREQGGPTQRSVLPGERPNYEVRTAMVKPTLQFHNCNFITKPGEQLAPDFWTRTLKEILGKIKANMDVTPEEVEFFHKHSGLMYHNYMTVWKKMRAVDMSFVDGDSGEIAKKIAGTPILRGVCPPCHVNHPDGGICGSQRSNGPRLPASLSSNHFWKSKAKAVIIGAEALFYQPPQGKEEFINLSDLPNKYYPVHYTGAPLDMADQGEGSLYQTIMSKILHIGSNSGLPLYVEFYKNPHHPQSRDSSHLCGFLRVLQAVQKTYLSPVICVIGPSIPSSQEGPVIYEQRKIKLDQIHQTANKLSWALGVPIFDLQVQTLPPYHNGFHMRATHWWEEPIFSETGITREYHRRVYIEMWQCQRNLASTLLTRDELNQMERIRRA